MSFENRIKDSFPVGLFGGLVSLIVFYFLIDWLRGILIDYTGNSALLKPPSVQLLAMLVNVISFRILLINYKKEKTAKGVLFITVILTLGYYFFLYRIKQ